MYAKRPFSDPKEVLAYLSRHTHRVAIDNSRLISMDQQKVTFQWKDYRLKGQHRYKTMTLSVNEFIRRFLLHVLPSGFHRIRHYGMVSNAQRKVVLPKVRELLISPESKEEAIKLLENVTATTEILIEKVTYRCSCCGSPMKVIETFMMGQLPRAPPLQSTGT